MQQKSGASRSFHADVRQTAASRTRHVHKKSANSLLFISVTGPGQTTAAPTDTPARAVARFVFWLALIWMVLQTCYTTLPLIRPGADIVLGAKFDSLVQGKLFSPSDRFRIFVFGNSKTMTGFRPEVFDSEFKTGVRSYNLGLPGEARFLPILKAALKAGNIPTHVFLTMPWDNAPDKPTLLDSLRDEEFMLYTLIPFRDLPRDAVIFIATSHMQFRQKYQEAAVERSRMLEQRGWYFIKSQSYFPNDELPDGYTIPTDRPNEVAPRVVPAISFVRSELATLAAHYNFEVVFVPGNMRAGAQAPAPDADAHRDTALSHHSDVRVIGPDYWVYPPSDFSDPVHLNPRGADRYTRDLAQLMQKSGALN
jgi:hypothetical protein